MIIYKILNKVNGKIYVGLTTKDLSRRIAEHIKENKSYIQKALNKYGLESFDISVIDHAEFRDTLCEKEKYWIQQFNSKSPNGYNLTDGGDGLINPTEETKKKIGKASSIRNKGQIGWMRGLTKETDKRIAKRAERMTGRTQTEESNIKRSKALAGIKKTKRHRQKMSHPHKMSPEGRAGIAASNRNPERLRKTSLKLTGENNPAKRPEVRSKMSESAKQRSKKS